MSQNQMNQNQIKLSKFLSLVLRHQPEKVHLQLEPEGWLNIEQLIENAGRIGRKFDRDTLLEIVETNDKKRFCISEDGLKIRASQGHSVKNVELGMKPTTPPQILYHGTVQNFLKSIRDSGLSKQNRNHVHLSADRATAETVGSRRGIPVLLIVDAERMHQDGLPFYLSDNKVWLTDCVPVEYLTFPESQSGSRTT